MGVSGKRFPEERGRRAKVHGTRNQTGGDNLAIAIIQQMKNAREIPGVFTFESGRYINQ
ncbi:hypothetical protein LBMAG53_01270 [Planctomycetota bacterium]|nr:hypothetical protein LBMAG53_01270 [Planctomycetota bacterium]